MEKQAKRLSADLAAADGGVPVDTAAQLALRVVGMPQPDPLQADDAIELRHRRRVGLLGADVVTGREDVTCIETHAEPCRVLDRLQHVRQVLEAVAEAGALSRRGLQ